MLNVLIPGRSVTHVLKRYGLPAQWGIAYCGFEGVTKSPGEPIKDRPRCKRCALQEALDG